MSVTSQTLALDGVRCAGCVLKLERNLAALPGVEMARGNATQKRLRIVWNDDCQTVDSLVRSIRDLGYDAREIAEASSLNTEPSLLPRLAVAALGMMNVMAFSVTVWFGQVTDMGHGTMQFMHWLSAGIAFPVMLYAGAVFHRPAVRALRAGHMTMDTPITLAIWLTFAGSLLETLRGSEDVYFDAVVSLIFFLLIGRVLEQAMRRRSDNAADNLRDLIRVTATRLSPDGSTESIDATDLVTGDRVLILPGMQVPADGVLLSADAEVDESVLTGETLPRKVGCGDAIVAGAIVISGQIEMEVRHVGAASQLGQMAQLVDEVASHKGRLQLLSDRFAQGYIPLVLIGGAFGFLLWFGVFGASFADALNIAVAVLIVTCPCAAGLATPAVMSRAANLAMQAGIVVKSGEALEQLADVDQIFLDKTGTASIPTLNGADSTHDGDQARERPRPDLAEFLAKMNQQSIPVSLCSGDTAPAVERFANNVGIEHWHSAQTPHDKLDQIISRQTKGCRVLMVGDGINDSAALSAAHVSMSFAGATDIAQSAADVVLTKPKLTLIPNAMRIAQSARRLIAQNLAFATLYNLLTVPLALAGFLTPAIAALLMSSSSIIVLANGFRLRALQ